MERIFVNIKIIMFMKFKVPFAFNKFFFVTVTVHYCGMLYGQSDKMFLII